MWGGGGVPLSGKLIQLPSCVALQSRMETLYCLFTQQGTICNLTILYLLTLLTSLNHPDVKKHILDFVICYRYIKNIYFVSGMK